MASGSVMLARRTGGKKETLPDGRPRRPAQREPWTGCRPICSRPRARGGRRPACAAPPRSSSSPTWRATGGFVYAGFCGRGRVRSGDQGADEGDDPGAARRGVPLAGGRRRPACGAAGRALPRRCGPRRTDAAPCRLFADAGLDRAGGGALPSAACRWRRSPARSARRSTCTTRRPSGRGTARSTRRWPACPIGSATRSRPTAPWRCCASCATWVPGADIVSGGELARVLAAGFGPARIVFSGVGKTAGRAPRRRSGPAWATSTSSRAEELERLAASPTRSGPSRGRDPGQSRRHHRYPPLHLDRQERDQVRRAGRPGAGGGGVRRRPSAARGSPPWRCTWAASSSDTEPFRQGIGRLLELVGGCARWRPTTLRCSISAAGSGSATPTSRRWIRRLRRGRRPAAGAHRLHRVPRAGPVPGGQRRRAR